jgi:hypothetical protein
MHSAGPMQVFVTMALSAIGFRAAARALQIVAPLLPGGLSCSANGGQFWLLRLGLYELARPKPQADDWVGMIDHTIQTGNGKCFLVVGVRVSQWNEKRLAALARDPDASFALEHHDLSVFAIEPMVSSKSEIVHRELARLSQATGIAPCCILRDRGADVRGGALQFCENTGDSDTVAVHDIAHAVANALKRQLHKNSDGEQFLADANKAKTPIRQTPYALLMPPELKNKARWMNLEPLIAWSNRVGEFLDHPQAALARAQLPLDLEVLEEKMGWLRQHADSIRRWTILMDVAAITLKYLRNQGYHRQAPPELQSSLAEFAVGPAEAMVREILDFVRA